MDIISNIYKEGNIVSVIGKFFEVEVYVGLFKLGGMFFEVVVEVIFDGIMNKKKRIMVGFDVVSVFVLVD